MFINIEILLCFIYISAVEIELKYPQNIWNQYFKIWNYSRDHNEVV